MVLDFVCLDTRIYIWLPGLLYMSSFWGMLTVMSFVMPYLRTRKPVSPLWCTLAFIGGALTCAAQGVLHEGAHALVAILTSAKVLAVGVMGLMSFGTMIKYNIVPPPVLQYAAISVAGPLAGILFGVLLKLIAKKMTGHPAELMKLFAFYTIITNALNLMPIPGFDGDMLLYLVGFQVW